MTSRDNKLDPAALNLNDELIVQGNSPTLLSRKQLTGNMLSLHDAEMQLINSGPLGMKRLAAARALDMQEMIPGLSERDAQKIGAGYVMLRMVGLTGRLINSTRAEVARVQANQRTLDDLS